MGGLVVVEGIFDGWGTKERRDRELCAIFPCFIGLNDFTYYLHWLNVQSPNLSLRLSLTENELKLERLI